MMKPVCLFITHNVAREIELDLMLLFSVLLITLLCLGIDELIAYEKSRSNEGAYRPTESIVPFFFFFFNSINING